jgi:hypothetical protein
MATWKSIPKKFRVEYMPKNPDQYFWEPKSGDVEFRWEYNTVSDILTTFAEHPDMNTIQELTGPDWAEAQLYILASYYATYVGREQLKDLLKDVLEE